MASSEDEPAARGSSSSDGSEAGSSGEPEPEREPDVRLPTPEFHEPLRFGATSTISQFQTSGELLIPRVRDDEVEPARSLRICKLDATWLRPEDQEGQLDGWCKEAAEEAAEKERDAAMPAWKREDVATGEKLLRLEYQVEQQHKAWKVAAGLTVKIEDLKAENGDAVRAATIQHEMEEVLQEIATLQRTRAEKRRAVAEEWRAADARLAAEALAKNTGAWKARGARWGKERRTSARQLEGRVREELKQALAPWSTKEAAQRQLGVKLDDSLRVFLGTLDLHEYAERFAAERHVAKITAELADLRPAALAALSEKVGLSEAQAERLSGGNSSSNPPPHLDSGMPLRECLCLQRYTPARARATRSRRRFSRALRRTRRGSSPESST